MWAPTLAVATLYFGIIGITTHLLVPMAHWYSVPTFLDAAVRDPSAARSAWTAFYVGHQRTTSTLEPRNQSHEP